MTETGSDSMLIGLTGSHGLVGQALATHLRSRGHRIRPIVRQRNPGSGQVAWDPEAKWLDASSLAGVDAVVHLAGEPLLDRWTETKKQRIRESRVEGTQLLAKSLAELDKLPRAFISASAIGYYGEGGDKVLTEQSPQGKGFLAEVAGEWEAAAKPAEQAGIRVAHPRFGVVLSPQGGALAQMAPIFRKGVGGKLGHGSQWMSWVALADAVGAIEHALTDRELTGPFNVVAPNPVTNAQFARTLGQVLGRPSFIPTPAFALRMAMGELADEALLVSQRVQPSKLQERGYAFQYPELKPALEAMFNR